MDKQIGQIHTESAPALLRLPTEIHSLIAAHLELDARIILRRLTSKSLLPEKRHQSLLLPATRYSREFQPLKTCEWRQTLFISILLRSRSQSLKLGRPQRIYSSFTWILHLYLKTSNHQRIMLRILIQRRQTQSSTRTSQIPNRHLEYPSLQWRKNEIRVLKKKLDSLFLLWTIWLEAVKARRVRLKGKMKSRKSNWNHFLS